MRFNFFFSSRRRHTRSLCDWSSDVCSSDLQVYPVKAGDLILVHAAAGGTGLILCQWAGALRATVIGTVSTEAKAELAHAHGCKHTILYSKQDFAAEGSRISSGGKLPVIFGSIGNDTCLRPLECLRP